MKLGVEVEMTYQKDGNGFLFECPAFPEIIIGTLTFDDGVKQSIDAVMMCLSVSLREGKPLPVGDHFRIKNAEDSPSITGEEETPFLQENEPNIERVGLSGLLELDMATA